MVLKEKDLGDSGPKAFSQQVRIREHRGPGDSPTAQAQGADGVGELLRLRGFGFGSGSGRSLKPAGGCCSSRIRITITTGFSEDSSHKPCGG